MNEKQIIFSIKDFKSEKAFSGFCRKNNVFLRKVRLQDAGKRLSVLAGFEKMGQKDREKAELSVLPDFLIFVGFSSQSLEEFLDAWHKTGAPDIPLKAIMTIYNQDWTMQSLLGELEKERSEIQKRNVIGEQ